MINLDKKIGYSEKCYLQYSNTWKYCIEFYFNIEEMHSSDLYLIMFSYFKNPKLFCLDVYSLAKETSKTSQQTKIFSRKISQDLSKMSYREFESWWEDRQWYDSMLLDSKEIYGFRISFVPELVEDYIKENDINLYTFYYGYKPEYPWSLEQIKMFEYYIDSANEEGFWKVSPKYEYYKKRGKR